VSRAVRRERAVARRRAPHANGAESGYTLMRRVARRRDVTPTPLTAHGDTTRSWLHARVRGAPRRERRGAPRVRRVFSLLKSSSFLARRDAAHATRRARRAPPPIFRATTSDTLRNVGGGGEFWRRHSERKRPPYKLGEHFPFGQWTLCVFQGVSVTCSDPHSATHTDLHHLF